MKCKNIFIRSALYYYKLYRGRLILKEVNVLCNIVLFNEIECIQSYYE